MSDERFEAPRSLLFAPGNEPRKLERALTSGADAVIADLEDAVPPAEKGRARELVAQALRDAATPSLRLVRVNTPDSEAGEADLAALEGAALDALVVPKAEPHRLARLGDDGSPLIALVETARGIHEVRDVAAHPRVVALALGGEDLAAELGLRRRADGLQLLHARSALVLASAEAGLRPPFDVVHVEVADLDGLRAEAELARSLGFGGKACIHPRQVDVVNDAFSPSPDEVAAAREIVAAFEAAGRDARGALVVRGQMVDRPVVAAAQRTLALGARLERNSGGADA